MTDMNQMQMTLRDKVTELEDDRAHIVRLNQLLQGIFMNMPGETYNQLCDVFLRRHIILGGDSCCLHIEDRPIMDEKFVVFDCNPVLAFNPDSTTLLPYAQVPIMRECEILTQWGKGVVKQASLETLLQRFEFQPIPNVLDATYANETFDFMPVDHGCKLLQRGDNRWNTFYDDDKGSGVDAATKFLNDWYMQRASDACAEE